jgi:hypothetical protein
MIIAHLKRNLYDSKREKERAVAYAAQSRKIITNVIKMREIAIEDN